MLSIPKLYSRFYMVYTPPDSQLTPQSLRPGQSTHTSGDALVASLPKPQAPRPPLSQFVNHFTLQL